MIFLILLITIYNGGLALSAEYKSFIKHDYDYNSLYDEKYEKYHLTATITPNLSHSHLYPRVKRFEGPARTLGPAEISDVKGALRNLFANRRMENPFTAIDVATDTVARNNKSIIHYDDNEGKIVSSKNVLTRTISPSSKFFELHPSRSPPKFFNLPPMEEVDNNILRNAGNITTQPTEPDKTDAEALPQSNATTVKVAGATTAKKPKEPKIDINALVNLIANLTYEYEMNLTQEFNETLQKYKIPTCPSLVVTTTTTEPTTTEYFANATIIAKCFVCGLMEAGVPTSGNCGDAFATDFMPLVPIDPKARGQVSRYRKYCRYLDTPNYFYNESIPHSIFGRWTGGCAVRWTDLTNAYTQRTCRQRLHPTTGRHFGSKRMAKLELALKDVDNGCLVSPMATLLPLSRGISLYARFHACVCTGNWCNKSIETKRCVRCGLILTLLITFVS